MGATSKTVSFLLRFWQLACATIVAGLFGQYLHYVDLAHVGGNGRIIYAVVLAGISILASLILLFWFKLSFRFFIFDFILFVCWIVAFGLVTNLTGTHGCHSSWYWRSWGYFWGGWWRRRPVSALSPAVVGTSACAKWRTALAFTILGGWGWFFSGILGAYVRSKPSDEQVASGQMGPMSKASHSVDHWYHQHGPSSHRTKEREMSESATSGQGERNTAEVV